MSDYGTMQNRIADEITRSDLTTQIRRAIQSALKFFSDYRFWFNTAVATKATVAEREYYDLPNDFENMDMLVLIDGTYRYELEKRPWQHIESEMEVTDYYALPDEYAVYDQALRLHPIPDQSYTMRMSYLRALPDVSASADTSAWFTHGEELIRTHAKIDLFTNVIRKQEYQGEIALLQDREDMLIRNLKSKLSSRESTGRFHPHEV